MGQSVRSCNRIVVFNTVHSFGTGPRQNRLPGFMQCSSLSHLVDLLRKHRAGRFRICYSPLEGDEQVEFWHVCNLVWEVRDCVLAVDEVWHFGNPLKTPRSLARKRPRHPFRSMELTGRHHGITVLWTAQAPALADYTLRRVSTQLYLGRLTTPEDREAFRGMIAEEALAKLPSLPNRNWVRRDELMNWNLARS